MIPLLEASAVSAGYLPPRGRLGTLPKLVVKEASFSVAPSSLVAILGANGCGKTTLLKTCIGLLPPLGGQARLGGKPVTKVSTRNRARLVAWVPQVSNSAWSFTAREVVAQGRYAALGPFKPFGEEDEKAIESALETLDALELASREFSSLSGGEARRVLIARALAQNAPLLALDEPAAHLDPGRQMELMEILLRLAKAGKAVVVSLHDVNAARRYADQVMLLGRHGESFFGTPAEALTPERLEEAYDTEFLHGDHESYGRFVLPLARKRKDTHTS
ncbi:MAG: ABC transporter ATP-binding protein [Clostridia bacterium]|jgi:iron complex transport system ATP-binding protein|nr:ABC transporter ATP-binding protein [Spirochaetia bacterium]